MAGHSKWSQIKHKKAKEDSKRGKAFTKLGKEISIAARLGGGDAAGNPRLRTLLSKAKAINMPIDNITRAIKRGTGETPGVSYDEYLYEGYGPGGIALIIEALSDNKNRTVAELRHLFSEYSGSLAENGAVSWLFQRQGVIRINGSRSFSEDEIVTALLDYTIYDCYKDDTSYVVTCDPKELDIVKSVLEKEGYLCESAEYEWIARTPVSLSEEQTQKAVDLLTALEDHDDVKNVFANMA